MTEIIDLVERLRGWGRRYEPMSQERKLFNAAADALEQQDLSIEAEVSRRLQDGITVEAVERRIGGKLLTWQRKALEGGKDAA